MNPATPINDPLADLKPIHLPLEPSTWPPAIGWWLVLLAGLSTLAALIIWWRRRQQRKAPLKQALQELDALQAELEGQPLLSALNQLLRRAAGHRHGPQVAALPVSQWAIFLQQHAPPELNADNEICHQLAESAYRQQQVEFSGKHIAYTRAWLKEVLAC